MKFNKKALLILLGLCSLTACTSQRIGDFTVASSKNINLNSNQFTVGERVYGEDMKAISWPNMKEAMDKAIEKDKCAVGLSDVVVEFKQRPFLRGYSVEGTQIIDRSLPGCANRL